MDSGNGVLTMQVNGSALFRRIREIMSTVQHDADWFMRFERAANQALDEDEERFLVMGEGNTNRAGP